jgi:hypothetical protein
MFLKLAGQIEGQLRDAYAHRYYEENLTQTALAKKLEIGRSEIHHRLMGGRNMTTETIADMVWALGYDISVEIFDPTIRTKSNFFIADDGDTDHAPIDVESSFSDDKLKIEFETAVVR